MKRKAWITQMCLQHLQRFGLVLVLAALVLYGHHSACKSTAA